MPAVDAEPDDDGVEQAFERARDVGQVITLRAKTKILRSRFAMTGCTHRSSPEATTVNEQKTLMHAIQKTLKQRSRNCLRP